MSEFLFSLDKGLLLFINQTLASPLGDVAWPFITDYAGFIPAKIALGIVWVLLIVRGGRKGRIVAGLLIPVLAVSDQMNSAILKELIGRPRPCHSINGEVIVEGIRLLVDCGPGWSFPSSHAVNNFAAAYLFSHYYRRYSRYFFGWGSLVALSRPAVGVHYPSDIIAGGMVGLAIAWGIVSLWERIDRRYVSPRTAGSHE